jgi:3-hydroxyisobutyrate dehydrogenase-like beta-hydroxyacid dehydrogenase
MGAGRMARTHAKAIGAAGGRVVTVYDVVESAAKSLAADVGASVAHSAEVQKRLSIVLMLLPP